MKVISPIEMTDALLSSSNVLEEDAPVWLVGTTYAAEANVMLDHAVYSSVVSSNTGNDPRTDDGTNWLDLGATNLWRVFDKKISTLTSRLGSIIYEITPVSLISGVGIINLTGGKVEVEVTDSSGRQVYYGENQRADSSEIVDWWAFFTTDFSESVVPDVIFDDVKCYTGNTIKITLSTEKPGSIVSIGQIVVGVALDLGKTLTGTTIGFKDFSTKERDPFGNAIIVERAYASTINFSFAVETNRAAFVSSKLASLRATPALYYSDARRTDMGVQAFGFFQDFDIPLSGTQISFANLKIEGLT